MKYTCQSCDRVVAKGRRLKAGLKLSPLGGAKLTLRDNEAPRIKCICGKVIIVVEGSL